MKIENFISKTDRYFTWAKYGEDYMLWGFVNEKTARDKTRSDIGFWKPKKIKYRMKTIILLLALCLTSCATHYKIDYVIQTPKGNFYTNDFVINNDPIFMVDFKPYGHIRRIGSNY